MEKEEGWSSEGSDGGVPVAPVALPAPKAKKSADFQPKDKNNAGRSKYSEGPWRSETRQMGGQRRLWEDNSRAAPPARPSKSSLPGKAAPFTTNLASLEDYMEKTTLSDTKSNKNGGYRGAKGNHVSTNKNAPAWLNE
jgi:hypothetical protein